ncbi:hypothetical protein J6590_081138 [Homalodisca vitripennis]|nr:hypothetical protein J6590_081138 [Homalodisca vitripennis]
MQEVGYDSPVCLQPCRSGALTQDRSAASRKHSQEFPESPRNRPVRPAGYQYMHTGSAYFTGEPSILSGLAE